MFRSLAELNSEQAAVRTAADFLKNFVCIDVAALPPEVDFLHYKQPSSHREAPIVKFRRQTKRLALQTIRSTAKVGCEATHC